MLPLTALYFPRTSVSTLQVSQELVFFDKIFHYLSAEEPEESTTDEAYPELCAGYAPVPFHGDLDRFRQLIRELKGNEAEFYSGHLSTITAGNEKNRDEQSVKSLIQSIGGKSAAEAKEQSQVREDLWRARLLLKLAEILYQEEQELQKELSAVSIKEHELFEALKGEPEIPFTPTPFQQMESTLPMRPKILVKAWAKLFLADRQQGNYSMLVSDQTDAAELLFDANETLTQKRPVRLFRIPLPASGEMELAASIQARTAFREAAKETLAGFRSLLSDTAAKGTTPDTLKNFSALAAEWTKIFNDSKAWHQPAGKAPLNANSSGEPHLEVYLCNESLPSLLGHVCKTAVQPQAATGSSLGLIALKSKRKSTCKG
ncbi:MAG: hypothetical protein KKC76_09565 [Proteobacteria bacterium]|nr:hypothetical protein [Pseudomonadota bacterium]MBU4297341.1 hypothetical protein [Pseudomonadota bacterium]MCG2748960.1 hypothetical protein [Desulfobulbaceae bacterium]